MVFVFFSPYETRSPHWAGWRKVLYYPFLCVLMVAFNVKSLALAVYDISSYCVIKTSRSLHWLFQNGITGIYTRYISWRKERAVVRRLRFAASADDFSYISVRSIRTRTSEIIVAILVGIYWSFAALFSFVKRVSIGFANAIYWSFVAIFSFVKIISIRLAPTVSRASQKMQTSALYTYYWAHNYAVDTWPFVQVRFWKICIKLWDFGSIIWTVVEKILIYTGLTSIWRFAGLMLEFARYSIDSVCWYWGHFSRWVKAKTRRGERPVWEGRGRAPPSAYYRGTNVRTGRNTNKNNQLNPNRFSIRSSLRYSMDMISRGTQGIGFIDLESGCNRAQSMRSERTARLVNPENAFFGNQSHGQPMRPGRLVYRGSVASGANIDNLTPLNTPTRSYREGQGRFFDDVDQVQLPTLAHFARHFPTLLDRNGMPTTEGPAIAGGEIRRFVPTSVLGGRIAESHNRVRHNTTAPLNTNDLSSRLSVVTTVPAATADGTENDSSWASQIDGGVLVRSNALNSSGASGITANQRSTNFSMPRRSESAFGISSIGNNADPSINRSAFSINDLSMAILEADISQGIVAPDVNASHRLSTMDLPGTMSPVRRSAVSIAQSPESVRSPKAHGPVSPLHQL